MSEGTNQRAELPAIYAATMAVMTEVQDIGKNRRMPKEAHVGEYAYRSNEDVQQAISAAFRACRIATQSRDVHLEQVQTKVAGRNGDTVWTSVFVTITYMFTSLDDGSTLEFAVAGEGRDNSDKATNKAFTAAHKIAVTQLFEVAYGALDPDSERPMIYQADEDRPPPPPQEDKRTPAQRAAQEAYEARRNAGMSQQQAVSRGEQDARQTAQSQPADPDPVGSATGLLQQEMGAAPVEQNGTTSDPAVLDKLAGQILTRAARDSVQADSRGEQTKPSGEAQYNRCKAAIAAAQATSDRTRINKVVLKASEEGLLGLQIDGHVVGQLLSAARGTAVS